MPRAPDKAGGLAAKRAVRRIDERPHRALPNKDAIPVGLRLGGGGRVLEVILPAMLGHPNSFHARLGAVVDRAVLHLPRHQRPAVVGPVDFPSPARVIGLNDPRESVDLLESIPGVQFRDGDGTHAPVVEEEPAVVIHEHRRIHISVLLRKRHLLSPLPLGRITGAVDAVHAIGREIQPILHHRDGWRVGLDDLFREPVFADPSPIGQIRQMPVTAGFRCEKPVRPFEYDQSRIGRFASAFLGPGLAETKAVFEVNGVTEG